MFLCQVFWGSLDDVSVVESKIIEYDAFWDLSDLTSENDRGPSALKLIQCLCPDCGLYVPNDVPLAPIFLSDALAALSSLRDGAASLVEH